MTSHKSESDTTPSHLPYTLRFAKPQVYAYHSCRNRHCPKCHGDQTERWLAQQQTRLLPCPYFLVTFTLPQELRPLAFANQKKVYGLMMRCAGAVESNSIELVLCSAQLLLTQPATQFLTQRRLPNWRQPHLLAARIVTLGYCLRCECCRRNGRCPHDHAIDTSARPSQ